MNKPSVMVGDPTRVFGTADFSSVFSVFRNWRYFKWNMVENFIVQKKIHKNSFCDWLFHMLTRDTQNNSINDRAYLVPDFYWCVTDRRIAVSWVRFPSSANGLC